jgi:gas vesicle protein
MNGSDEVSTAPKNAREGAIGVADQVVAAGRDLQSAAMDLAGASGEALKGHASELVDSAKDIASKAGERLQETVAQQKGAGADYVSNLAESIRRAAGEFDADVPLAATYIRKAADQVTNAADALREGNLNDLLQRAQSFARNQPTAFVGLAVLAGFGAVRFLKSASNASDAPAASADDNLGITARQGN